MADTDSRAGLVYFTRELLDWTTQLHAPNDVALQQAFDAPGKHGMPSIQLAPSEAKLTELLLRLAGARKVVEVGTLAGYSALRLARALPPDGEVHTIEFDPKHAEVARQVIAAAGENKRITVHVGQAIRRDVLGWGSMDPARPGIWIRPRRLAYFTIAHELTHLLQARKLVPTGERACDLHALARSPLVIDSLPGYLELPGGMRGRSAPEASLASTLHRLAREAIARREAGDRRYLSGFEHALAKAYQAPPWHRRVRRALADAVATLRLELDS